MKDKSKFFLILTVGIAFIIFCWVFLLGSGFGFLGQALLQIALVYFLILAVPVIAIYYIWKFIQPRKRSK